MIKHIDLFSGIGGFALAADRIFGDVDHIFCDNDKFCQQVLKKHWPESKIYGDIRTLRNERSSPDTDIDGRASRKEKIYPAETDKQALDNTEEHYGKDAIITLTNAESERGGTEPGNFQEKTDRPSEQLSEPWSTDMFILTGGFPCQPFSQAGRRKGTEDDRYLWPEMLRVIREFRPTWVIAENVRGLLTQGGGVVFEQVCTDMEGEGYDVQPIVIPAVAVNAPHRRERVWFIANRKDKHEERGEPVGSGRGKSEEETGDGDSDAPYSIRERTRGRMEGDGQVLARGRSETENERPDWEREWVEVATELCGMDDGLPVRLDGFECTKSQNRSHQLKAYGNAIVPQVAMRIMEGIKSTYR